MRPTSVLHRSMQALCVVAQQTGELVSQDELAA